MAALLSISETEETSQESPPEPLLLPLLAAWPPWPLALPPQLPALRTLAAKAGAETFFHLWDQLAATSLALTCTSSPPIFCIVTASDATWSGLLPPPPIPPALLRSLVGAGLTSGPLSLSTPSSVRTVGGGTLVVEPGEGGDPLTVNDQMAVEVVKEGACCLVLLAKPPGLGRRGEGHLLQENQE